VHTWLAAQSLCRDARAVPAGGALEIEVARQLREFGSKETGLDQYAIAKFADALEVVPRTIAENSGGALLLGWLLRTSVDVLHQAQAVHCTFTVPCCWRLSFD
jgi:chaperonin GroEL (HSP60 family)